MAIVSCIPVTPNKDMSVHEFKAWLNRFDTDKDGRISREELKQALHNLQVWFGWWKARQGIKEADANGNGRIDREEIDKLITYAQQHLHMKIYESRW
ncbi:hypothetical protein HHK36_030915 [Tetracentron sinense]|uniref:EF-hand domain-containing protein n=1 Tax=Tetracentron sinense TaxID=13715 RepID=A0A835D1Z7_TETSI|nr:hypothetical protein HHK36_030915 [Tetracentron sinense]